MFWVLSTFIWSKCQNVLQIWVFSFKSWSSALQSGLHLMTTRNLQLTGSFLSYALPNPRQGTVLFSLKMNQTKSQVFIWLFGGNSSHTLSTSRPPQTPANPRDPAVMIPLKSSEKFCISAGIKPSSVWTNLLISRFIFSHSLCWLDGMELSQLRRRKIWMKRKFRHSRFRQFQERVWYARCENASIDIYVRDIFWWPKLKAKVC